MATNAMPRDNEVSSAAEDEDECPICHELYKSITEKTFLPCAHYFHKDCIDQWLAAHDSCPICRSFPLAGTFPNEATFPADANAVIDLNPTFDAIQQDQLNEHLQHAEENLHQILQNLQEARRILQEIKQGIQQQNLSE